MWINGVGERQVRHGTALVDRHLMGIFVHHADQKVSGVLIGRLGSGLPFRKLRNYVMLMPPAIIPGTGERDFSISCLPQKRFLTAMHQRKHGSRHNRNIGAANELQQSQGMRYLFVAPLVSADDGYAQHFHLRRLNQGQQRLHVAAAGPRTILIDDDLPALLRESQAIRNQQK